MEEQQPEEAPQFFIPVELVSAPVMCRRCYVFYVGVAYKGFTASHINCPHCGGSQSAQQVPSLLYQN